MPNTNSAAKRVRQDVHRRLRNRSAKSRLRNSVRAVADALKKGDIKAADANLREASGLLDRASQKHVIHRNKAARLKSAMAKKIDAAKKG